MNLKQCYNKILTTADLRECGKGENFKKELMIHVLKREQLKIKKRL